MYAGHPGQVHLGQHPQQQSGGVSGHPDGSHGGHHSMAAHPAYASPYPSASAAMDSGVSAAVVLAAANSSSDGRAPTPTPGSAPGPGRRARSGSMPRSPASLDADTGASSEMLSLLDSRNVDVRIRSIVAVAEQEAAAKLQDAHPDDGEPVPVFCAALSRRSADSPRLRPGPP